MKILVTIPAKDEASTLKSVITGFLDVAAIYHYSMEIQVLDNGSIDATAEIARKAGAIVYSRPDLNSLASVFHAEMEYCQQRDADVIVHVDADGQYEPGDLPLLINEVKHNTLVLGNRLSRKPIGMSSLRYEGNLLLSKIVSVLIKQDIVDSQTGYRVFPVELAREIKITSNYTYTQEQVIRSSFQGVDLVEVPVNFLPRIGSESRLMRSPFHYFSEVSQDLENLMKELKPELLEYE